MFLAESSIQLVPDGTLLIHLVMIVIMVAVLNKTLLKPINKILSDRENQIQGKMSEAEEMAMKADGKLKEYHAALRQARTEGYRLLEKERAEVLREREARVRSSKEELARVVAANLDSTNSQEEQVKSQLESQAADIGSLISSQVLGR
jgi:F-type H+-transporting ATPase subunit b